MGTSFSNPFNPGTQNWRVLEMLRQSPRTNAEFSRAGILKYTGRISQVRQAIRPNLMGVKKESCPGCRGLVTYSLTGVPQ